MVSTSKPPLHFVVISIFAITFSLIIVLISGEISLDWKIFLKSTNLYLPILGYVLSPFIPILCLALLRNKDNNLRSDIYYDIGKGNFLVKIASLLSFVGFIIGLIHIARISFSLQAFL